MMFVRKSMTGSWGVSMPILAKKHTMALLAAAGISLLLIVYSFTNAISLDTEWISSHGAENSIKPTPELPVSPVPGPVPVAGGIPLRIMCLGASVVKGEVSNGTVGFRKELRETLVAAGNPVNMVGAEKVGDMKDNDVEARGGNRVDQVYDWATHSVFQMKPNLFILNVGSNDCLQHYDTQNYFIRLNDFILYLLEASPRGTIILSTLLTNTVQDMEPCIMDINRQMRTLYTILESQGKHIILSEMHDKFVPENDTLPRPHRSEITPDGTHPNEVGYSMMAKILLQSIREVDQLGYLLPPQDAPGIMDDGEVEKDVQAKQLEVDDLKRMTDRLERIAKAKETGGYEIHEVQASNHKTPGGSEAQDAKSGDRNKIKSSARRRQVRHHRETRPGVP